MSPNNNFDTGPLTWVKDEINVALGQARDNLVLAKQNTNARELFRYAQSFVHQANGALSVVGLDGVVQFAEAIDKLLSSMVSRQEAPSLGDVSLADRSIVALSNYIFELLAGAPHQALRLFPLFRELVMAAGQEEPLPNELFFPDLSLRPELSEPAAIADIALEVKKLRSRFEKGLLGWMLHPAEAQGTSEMLQVVKRLEQIPDVQLTRAFWWVSIAFFEGVAARSILANRHTLRFCRRIDAQMQRLADGSKVVAERLIRDALYFVATANIKTPHAELVCKTYRIDDLLPDTDGAILEIPRQPLIQNLREILDQSKELWNRFCAGETGALETFKSRYTELLSAVGPLKITQLQHVLLELGKLITWLGDNPSKINDGLAMDVATGLLVIEQVTAASIVRDPKALRRQTEVLCGRYAARCREEILPPLEDSFFSDAPQQNQSKLFFDQLAREILSNLGQIEQTLEAFFHNPDTRDALAGLDVPIKQVEGAFSILGEQAARQLVKESGEQITKMRLSSSNPESAECDDLAYKLSALGFYVEALRSGPASLESFLESSATKKAAEQIASSPVSVAPSQVTPSGPSNKIEQTFESLVTGIEALQQEEALNLVHAPVRVPEPSEETTRLMSASSEELDAELLEIFLAEAREVIETQTDNTAKATKNPSDREAMVTIRRGFHTLKGSSRMVGLQLFSEAARHVEMAMNRWLQLEKDVSKEVLDLINEAIGVFTDWVTQLEEGGGSTRDASALIEHAQQLLASLDVTVTTPSTPEVAPAGVTAAPDFDATMGALSLTSAIAHMPELQAGQGSGADNSDVEHLVFPSVPTADSQMADFGSLMERGPDDLVDLGVQANNVGINTFFGITSDAVSSSAEGATSTAVFIQSVEPEEKAHSLENLGVEPFILSSSSEPEANQSLDLDFSGNDLSENEEDHTAGSVSTSLMLDSTGSGWEAEARENASLNVEHILFDEPSSDAVTPDNFIGVESSQTSTLLLNRGGGILSLNENATISDPLASHADLREPEIVMLVEAPSAGESDVVIGNQTLSRPLYTIYLTEAQQHLANLKEEIERMSANPLHVPSQRGVRAAHTLAGISGTARIQPARELAKALENGLLRFFEAEKPLDRNQVALISLALKAAIGMINDVEHMRMPFDAKEIVDQLEAMRPPVPVFNNKAATISRSEDDSHVERAEVKDEIDEQLLSIFLEESEDLISELGGTLRILREEPQNVGAQQSLARSLHTLKGSSRMAGAMRLGEYVHGVETRLQSGSMTIEMVEVLEQAFDHINAMVAVLRDPSAQTPEAPELLIEQEDSEEDLPLVDQPAVRAPAADVAARSIEPSALVADTEVDEQSPNEVEAAALSARATLRVKADLVDRFVNEAGEISIVRTRVEGEMQSLRRSLLDLTENVVRLRNQLREVEIQAESQMQSRIAAAEAQHADFDPLEFDRFTRLQELTRMMAESVGDVTTVQQNLLRNLDSADLSLNTQARLSRDLQQALMRVRMVSFEEIVDRLYRLVRQSARELGKRASLDIAGGIEVDRGILDRMMPPLEHLLRNAIAHGIETPEERVAAGKPETGRITLTLNQLSNEISIELADDGRGLNYERIRARGLESGLIKPDESPSEEQLAQLIFAPGFSTAEKVSDIAGRGVGMDVVKSGTLSVGGRIDLFSTPGQSTRFLIHLPLTLALTQALLVRSNKRTYALPANLVDKALELDDAALQKARANAFVEHDGKKYALYYLPRLLGDTQTMPATGIIHTVLLMQLGSIYMALHVDELAGSQEIIVKNAGPQFVRLQGFTGATVLPNGEVSVILNPAVLLSLFEPEALKYNVGSISVETGEKLPQIMVVDDSLTVRKFTTRLLEREGYHVITAKDGLDALEQLETVKPDVMLLDIEMPRMDGFELTRNIRADDRLRDLPIIMITSRMADKHRNYAEEIGVNHYLGKPFQEDKLLELIKTFVSV